MDRRLFLKLTVSGAVLVGAQHMLPMRLSEDGFIEGYRAALYRFGRHRQTVNVMGWDDGETWEGHRLKASVVKFTLRVKEHCEFDEIRLLRGGSVEIEMMVGSASLSLTPADTLYVTHTRNYSYV